ncbi:hypothetical protein EVAR_40014_1 [Eumeta japonica]|uniref:Uncharacterized protein n=1 Tax=Eumeta variegata TaxID=151549 RepID=A0A4C1YLQ4_EUMVA|nr:hypothetical protein EVAR_40014_1 [Eumeta japonica]
MNHKQASTSVKHTSSYHTRHVTPSCFTAVKNDHCLLFSTHIAYDALERFRVTLSFYSFATPVRDWWRLSHVKVKSLAPGHEEQVEASLTHVTILVTSAESDAAITLRLLAAPDSR